MGEQDLSHRNVRHTALPGDTHHTKSPDRSKRTSVGVRSRSPVSRLLLQCRDTLSSMNNRENVKISLAGF